MRFAAAMLLTGLLVLPVCFSTGIREGRAAAENVPPAEKIPFSSAAQPRSASRRTEWVETTQETVLRLILSEKHPVCIKQFVINNENITK